MGDSSGVVASQISISSEYATSNTYISNVTCLYAVYLHRILYTQMSNQSSAAYSTAERYNYLNAFSNVHVFLHQVYLSRALTMKHSPYELC